MTPCIICGLDERLRWLWPWFAAQLDAHTGGLPVRVYDFGVRTRIDRPMHHGLKQGWFGKPAAILDTLNSTEHDAAIWIDLDVELFADIPALFEGLSPDTEIAGTPDPWMPNKFLITPQPYVEPGHGYTDPAGMVLNTGLLYVRRGCRYAFEWRRLTLFGKFRGDEEALAEVCRVGDPGVAALAPEVMVMKLGPVAWSKNAKAIHWTGQDGKDIIARKILDTKRRMV